MQLIEVRYILSCFTDIYNLNALIICPMRLQRLYRELEEAILKRNLLAFWKKQEKVNYAIEIKALSALNISKLGMFSIRY